MVHIRYDAEADALYAELRRAEGKVRTREIDDRRLVDVDESGRRWASSCCSSAAA